MHLEAVAKGQIRNLLISVFPGSMKSLLTAVFFPAWLWTTRPQSRFMFASYAASLSVRDSVRCRRVIESAWYQRHWGMRLGADNVGVENNRFSLMDDQNQKVRFDNSAFGFRIATSVGGVGTGERAGYICVDDAHNVKERESEAKRAGVIDWFDIAYANRLCDYKKDCRIVIGQRVHEADLIGHLQESGEWQQRPCDGLGRRRPSNSPANPLRNIELLVGSGIVNE